MNFQLPLHLASDSYARYLIRIEEIRQSLIIIEQTINQMPNGDIKNQDQKITAPLRSNLKKDMEQLIHHFKFFSEGLSSLPSFTYIGIEAPKGEMGVYLVTKDTNLNITELSPNMPVRCQIRSPGFFHLQSINKMVEAFLLADLVTVIGTQDLVFGEIDR